MNPREQYIHRELEKLDAALGASLSTGWRQTIKGAINAPNDWAPTTSASKSFSPNTTKDSKARACRIWTGISSKP